MPSGSPPTHSEHLVDDLVARGLAALPDIAEVRRHLDQLATLRGDRALFGTCVLILELALLKDARARAELPDHVGVLLEAFHDPKLAAILVAGSEALEARWLRIRPVVADFVALRRAAPVPPPRTPTPARPVVALATPTELVEDIQELIAAKSRPPPPPPEALALPEPLLGVLGAQESIDPPVRAFWAYTEKALGRLPDPDQSIVGAQSFVAQRGSDRSRLVRFAHDLVARFPNLPLAQSLAALTLLYVAGQEKERGLLGINRERLRLITAGLSLLGEGSALSQAAVLFESDGPQTLRAFAAVVEIVSSYLAFCLRQGLDPKQASAAARFART